MGIIIDIILLAILILSAFAGYKKGLVNLATKLFAGILAIIITIIIYKPVSGIIINNTDIDEKIENAILENTNNFIDSKTEENNAITNQIKDEIVEEQTKNMASNIIDAIIGIIVFIVVKIILGIIISFIDFVAKLPILKQFNEIGGIIYGLIRGIIIAFVCIVLMGAFAKVNPESELSKTIDTSILTRTVYENILKF